MVLDGANGAGGADGADGADGAIDADGCDRSAVIRCGCSVFCTHLRRAPARLDTGYPAVGIMCGRTAPRSLSFLAVAMIDSFARVSGWEQLYHLWELLVMVAKFLWGLLRLLGGG